MQRPAQQQGQGAPQAGDDTGPDRARRQLLGAVRDLRAGARHLAPVPLPLPSSGSARRHRAGRVPTGRPGPTGGARGRQGAHRPVVLVHGYGGRPSQWEPLAAALASAGFDAVSSFTYRSFSDDIPTVARQLRHAVEDLVAVAGADDVHLVGHSLGGVILRYAVCVAGLDPLVASAVTIASPHGGSPLSPLGIGPAVAQLRCGSELLRRVDRSARAGHARWVAFAAGADVVVPPARARVRPPALAAENIELPGEGHLTILGSARLAALVVDRLCEAEADAAPTAA